VKQNSLFGPEPSPWDDADREDLQCAQIAFNRPLETTFDYLVPDELRGRLQPGQRVKVPFGRGDQVTIGYCVGLGRPQRLDRLKRIRELLDDAPLLTPHMLELTRWISERYLCSWGQVLESVIPAGVKNKAGTREQLFVEINQEVWGAQAQVKLPPKQAAVMQALAEAGQPLLQEDLARRAGCGTGPITALRHKQFVRARLQRSEPVGPAAAGPADEQDLVLNGEQQQVLDRILDALRSGEHKTQLLCGVTGSGKTEVYIRAIREVVSYGRQAIVLVPEISLTPQTIRRFRSRFAAVAVLHSHLSDADRHSQWQQIAQGKVQVVVGARSAVFAPVPYLGLIIIDEEHETSFKQDTTPRYHAREVARRRAEIERVPLLLGSATPTLESWLRARTGLDELLRLPRRVAGLPMPPVSIVDVREDPLINQGGAIGRALRNVMHDALQAGGQIILFLNLRGFSPVIYCRGCGSPVKCPHCDVSLTWHKECKLALCHSCNYQTDPPSVCPQCQKPGIRFLGTGTQRLEQEVCARFPKASVLRMDSDSMRRPGSHDAALERFRSGEVQILLGTQMISKGLDFPNVTLVGVIDADTMLHQPDLRAQERTFQLIAQVAGRTGRSRKGGRVLVQTTSPTEPAIVRAARHDFVGFAQAELENRKQMGAPPFTHLARVIVRGADEKQVQAEAQRMADAFRARVAETHAAVRVLGPAPAPITRLKGFFRYHFQLATARVEDLQQLWRGVLPALSAVKGIEFAVDVDPLNLR